MSVLQRYAFQCKQSKLSHTFAKIDVSRGGYRKNVNASPQFCREKKDGSAVPHLKSFYYLCKTWPSATRL